jgi:hypothetical protein
MKKLIHWPSFLAFAGISALVGAGLHYFAGLSFWYAGVIVAGAMLVNGIVAAIEDEGPGGFNNPKPKHSTPQDE